MVLRKKITFIIQDAGSGHRASARALQDIIVERGYPWDISIVNMQREVLNDTNGENLYNFLITKKLDFLFWPLFGPLIRTYVKRQHNSGKRKMRPFWKKEKPDLVLSLMTFINKAQYESLQEALPGTPYMTVMLDLRDHPPAFWIEKIAQTLIVPTKAAEDQARRLVSDTTTVYRSSGVVIHPRFYNVQKGDRAEELQKLGLKSDRPVFFMMFGGVGSPIMVDILRELQNLKEPFQVICICGRNEKLKSEVEELDLNYPIYTSGFTKDIPHFMNLSDYYIGKPGPGSMAEAIQMKLPIITFDSFNTLHHERYNLTWLEENSFGIVVKRRREIVSAAATLLSKEDGAVYRKAIDHYENRALFEVCDIIEEQLVAE